MDTRSRSILTQGATGSLSSSPISSVAPTDELATRLPEQQTSDPAFDSERLNSRDHAAISPSTFSARTSNVTDPPRVAIVLTRSDFPDMASLSGQIVAVDGNIGSREFLENALAEAGASRALLSEGPSAALDRLIEGEVSAAVLTVTSPAAASQFPQINGFNAFRIPLTTR